MAFVSDFKKCFQAGLEPYGFKKMKGTNCFGKLVNNEILLYISFRNRSALQRGNKAFSVLSGVQTIYSYDLSIHQLGLSGISLINYNLPGSGILGKDVFEYKPDNISKKLEEALDQTLTIAIPELLTVVDLHSCVEFLSKYRLDLLQLADQIYRDSVLLIMTNNHDSFESAFNQAEASTLRAFGNDASNQSYKESIEAIHRTITEDLIKSRDTVWDNINLQQEIYNEVNRRAENNRAILKQYGLL